MTNILGITLLDGIFGYWGKQANCLTKIPFSVEDENLPLAEKTHTILIEERLRV